MAPGRVAKLWLVAILLTVVLSVAAAAVTTTTTKTTTTTTTTKAPSTTANAAKQSPVTEDEPDPVPQDDGLGGDDTAPSAPVDGMDPAVDDPDMEEDDPPTGGSATGGSAGGSVGGAAVGDDVEASAGDDAGGDGDEGKAGTGKRSVADTWDSFKDKMKDAKEKAKEMYEKSKDAIKNAFANWPQKIKDKFNGLSETIKTKIFGGKASNLTAEEIGSLNKNQLRMLVPMSGVAGMNETLQQKVFDRFMALNDGQSMRRVLESMDVKTRADLIERIEDVNSKLGGDEMGKQRLVMSMTDKLGDPRNWTAAEVDMMKSKNILKFIPPARLTRINDTAILSKIDIPRKASMKSKKMADQKAWADFILHKRMSAKAVGEWTSTDINAREGDFSVKDLLGNIPLKTLNMIKNDALYDSFSSQPAAESVSQSE